MDLGEALFDRHELAVRAGCHVAEGQHARNHLWRWLELQAQDVGESAFPGLDDGAGVMGDQPAQQGVGVLSVAQVPGAVECVQARGGEAGRVADVVQPRSGFQQTGISAENRCRLRARAATPWTCAQRRGRDSWRSTWASCSAHEASVFMRPRLDSRGGTLTDVASRLKTSCCSLRPTTRLDSTPIETSSPFTARLARFLALPARPVREGRPWKRGRLPGALAFPVHPGRDARNVDVQ
jgi:hypothetical protein